MKTVYLCGTITPDPKYLHWREEVIKRFEDTDIVPVSPVRGKDPSNWTRDGLEGVGDVPYSDGGFVARDFRDIDRCEAVLMYFMEAPDRQSIGTFMECGYAYAKGKPIVVCSNLPEVIKHPFIYKTVAKITGDLDSACEFIEFLLMRENYGN